MIKHLAILMAMAEEAQPIIDALKLSPATEPLHKDLPFKLYQGSYGALQVSIVVSGTDPRYDVDNIGTQAATLMAFVVVEKLKPDLMISAGTAGGFKKRGASVGTVYLSRDRFVFHDRRVPLPGFDESSIGHYPALDVSEMARALNMPMGIVSTGSSLEKSDKDIEVIERFEAVAKEMEVAAIAWVCWLTQTPLVAVKSITNLLDEAEASESQFVENLKFSSQRLQEKLQQVIAYCENKTLAELGSR